MTLSSVVRNVMHWELINRAEGGAASASFFSKKNEYVMISEKGILKKHVEIAIRYDDSSSSTSVSFRLRSYKQEALDSKEFNELITFYNTSSGR